MGCKVQTIESRKDDDHKKSQLLLLAEVSMCSDPPTNISPFDVLQDLHTKSVVI